MKVFQLLRFLALAVSAGWAAKLPLATQSVPDINQGSDLSLSVPAQPSGLYGTPLKPFQPPAGASAEFGASHEAGPGAIQQPPSIHETPGDSLQGSDHHPPSFGSPSDLVQVPDVPSGLYETPLGPFPGPGDTPATSTTHHQTPPLLAGPTHQVGSPSGSVQTFSSEYITPDEPISGLVQPASLVETPGITHPSSAEQGGPGPILPPSFLQTQSELVQSSVEHEASPVVVSGPAGPLDVFATSSDQGQSSVEHGTLDHAVPVPIIPSGLYETPSASSPIVPTGSFQGPSEPHQPAVEFGSPDQAASSPIVPTDSFQGPSEPHQPAVEFGSPDQVASSPIVPTGSFQGPSEPHQPAVEFGSPDQVASSPFVPTGSFQGPSEPHQPAVEFGSSGEVDRAPGVPSGLYETPSAAVSSPDQPSPSLGTPSGIISGPPEPSSVFDTSVEQIHAVPVQPSSIVDTPDGSFSHPIELSKGSEGLSFPVPAAPSGLYEVPLIPGPETPTIFQPSHNMPIIFPGGAPGIIEGPSQAAPIPAQPSTLYGVPEVPSGLYETPKGRGKAMFLIDEVQSEPVKAQSLFYEASADANTPVLSVAQPMEGMPYDFSWGVEDSASGNLFTHRENSDGQSTNGQYRVTLPDGRVQVVTFYDNGDGFHTDISYE